MESGLCLGHLKRASASSWYINKTETAAKSQDTMLVLACAWVAHVLEVEPCRSLIATKVSVCNPTTVFVREHISGC
jgi:hypothetical protein